MRPSYSELERHREREREISFFIAQVCKFISSFSSTFLPWFVPLLHFYYLLLSLFGCWEKNFLWVRKFQGLVEYCTFVLLQVLGYNCTWVCVCLFVLDLWGLLLSQSHSCFVSSVMNSLLFILFCLIRLDPVWFLWKKKVGVVGELKETKDFMLKTKVLLYMFIQKRAFSIFFIFVC